MKRPKHIKSQQTNIPLQRNWLDIINDESNKPVIPVGPRFQAEIPVWTGPPHSEYYKDFSSTKWLGVRVWPIKDRSLQTNVEGVGKGRPNFCSCPSPGSIECVKRHISDRRLQLQFELGPVFREWKFDEMGEEISKLWNLQEQQEFDSIVKRSSPSQGNSFLELALEHFPAKQRETIVRYYFNVYVPRRMKIQTRSGCEIVDTDDDEDDGVHCPESSRKRCRANGVTVKSGNYVKDNYLKRR